MPPKSKPMNNLGIRNQPKVTKKKGLNTAVADRKSESLVGWTKRYFRQ